MRSRDQRLLADEGPLGTGVFLSYRRADTSAVATLLAERLMSKLGEPRVFLDVWTIKSGLSFPEQLREAIAQSAVMLVLIGPNWLTDARLDDPHDHLRKEVEEGLRRGLLVIPVLVDGASMPRSAELPPVLSKLADLQAMQIAHPAYRPDYDVVVSRVVGHLKVGTPPLAMIAAVVVLIVLAGASLVTFRDAWMPGEATVPSTAGPPAPTAAPAVADPPIPTIGASSPHDPAPATTGPDGTATLQAVYDQPDGCRAVATITGDLRGDPRAAGGVLWVVAVLDATPNVLYYPKIQVTATDGRFRADIDLNQTSGSRRGRFGLVVSPNDRARDDMQRSLDADIAKNDSAYPDDRRTKLQLGNVEIATTPFVAQQC